MARNEIVSSDAAKSRFDVGPVIAPVSLLEQVDVVIRYRLFIAMVALSITALGALYAYSRPSTYEANLLIQVTDMRSVEPKSLLGYASPGAAFKRAMSEVELLRSRAIVGAAVDRLSLDVSARPRYFPIVGAPFARWNARTNMLATSAYGGYAWGAERIRIGSLDMPEALLGTRFDVTKTGPGRFRIAHEETGSTMAGRVGDSLQMRVGQQVVALRIDELIGAAGARYVLSRSPRVAVVDELSSSLSVAELGKDTGMIRVSLQHTDPRVAEGFLNALSLAYMDYVRGERGRDMGRSLEVLSAQLPVLKKRVEIAEARYEAFRRRERAADLAEDTRLQLSRYSETNSRLSELRQKRAELAVRLGDEHPELRAVDQQIAGVSRDSSSLAGDMRRLPAVSTELDRLARDLKAETDIYASVLRRVEEMRVDAQDRSSNVRIIDEAVVPIEAADSRGIVLLFAAALGIAIGIAGAFVRKLRAAMRPERLYEAEEAEEHLPSHYAHARG